MSATDVDLVGMASSSVSMDGARRYSLVYRVLTNDRDDQGITAMTAAGIPSTRDYMQCGNDYDRGAYPREYSAALQSEGDDGKTWLVTVQFESTGGSDSSTNRRQDSTDATGSFYEYPWDVPARISGHGIEIQTTATHTYANASGGGARTAIVNSVGEPPPDEVVYYQASASLTIEQDFRLWPEDLEDYANTLNNATFFGKAAGTWRMGFPRWSKLYTGGGDSYYNILFEFYYDEDGWNNKTVRQAGWNCLADFSASIPTRAKDPEGMPTADPVLLDEVGYKLAYGETPLSITVHPYKTKNFGALGIPTSR